MANEIYGNLKGIRNSVIDELKTFYDIRIEGGSLLNTELAMRMADVTDFAPNDATHPAFGAALRQAAEAVKAGDHARAQAILQPVLQTEQAQALLQKLDG